MSEEELEHSDLIAELRAVDDAAAQLSSGWFSYQAFYVILTSFTALDSDSDGFLTEDDLRQYGNQCFTYHFVHPVPIRDLTVSRLMEGAGQCFVKETPGVLSYEEFICTRVAWL